jgi:hypothetical protein
MHRLNEVTTTAYEKIQSAREASPTQVEDNAVSQTEAREGISLMFPTAEVYEAML